MQLLLATLGPPTAIVHDHVVTQEQLLRELLFAPNQARHRMLINETNPPLDAGQREPEWLHRVGLANHRVRGQRHGHQAAARTIREQTLARLEAAACAHGLPNAR